MIEFNANLARILELIVNSMYVEKEMFLRELLNNASDALTKLRFFLDDPEQMSKLNIIIAPDLINRTLTIQDNGIGMNYNELIENLGTVAKSGTFDFKKNNYNNLLEKKLTINGGFGVGFYSVFMIADKIEVYTSAYKENKTYYWSCESSHGYNIEESNTQLNSSGTKIILHLKKDTIYYNYSKFLNEDTLRRLVKQYSDNIKYPIMLQITKFIRVDQWE